MSHFVGCAIVLVSWLMFPRSAWATGIMMPDLGLDTALFALSGTFAVALVLWAVLRVTPFWRARLKTHRGLALLGKINPPLLLVVVVASGWLFLSDSWLLLVPMLMGVPIAVLGILVELIWGFMIDPADRNDSLNED